MEGTNDFDKYMNAPLVDVIVIWNAPDPGAKASPGFETVFHQGRLKILRRASTRVVSP
jgi:hypothetical protein